MKILRKHPYTSLHFEYRLVTIRIDGALYVQRSHFLEKNTFLHASLHCL